VDGTKAARVERGRVPHYVDVGEKEERAVRRSRRARAEGDGAGKGGAAAAAGAAAPNRVARRRHDRHRRGDTPHRVDVHAWEGGGADGRLHGGHGAAAADAAAAATPATPSGGGPRLKHGQNGDHMHAAARARRRKAVQPPPQRRGPPRQRHDDRDRDGRGRDALFKRDHAPAVEAAGDGHGRRRVAAAAEVVRVQPHFNAGGAAEAVVGAAD